MWQFHDDIQARIQNYGEFPEPFLVTNGVRVECFTATALYNMMVSVMIMDAFRDRETGFPIRYHFNGKLFNLRSLQAKTKTQTDVQHELL